MVKNLQFDFNVPLNKGNSENKTFGCRQKNPDICSSNCAEKICAFTSADNICKKPSITWKKQYMKLINQDKEK